MHTKTVFAAILLALSTVAGTAGARPPVEPQTTSGWFANRIVGTYQSDANVRMCGSAGPDMKVVNTITFNAGGTVIANPRFPPTGAPDAYGPGMGTRTPDMGTWSYSPRTNRFSIKLRFDTFVDGAFHGTGNVEREIQLSIDGNSGSGPVHVTMRAPDGSVLGEQCGTATSTRL